MGNSTLADFMPYIQSDVIGVNRPTLERMIRLTIVEFCEKTWILTKGITHTVDSDDPDTDMFDSIIINTKGYFRYHRPFAIKELRVDGVPWDMKYMEMTNDSNYIEDMRGSGTKIFEIYNTYSIRIAPFSSSAEVFIVAAFVPLLDMTYVDDRIYNDWVEAIAAGVKMRLMDTPGKFYTNHPAANRWERIYRSKISDARRRMNKQHSGQSGHVNPREFGFM